MFKNIWFWLDPHRLRYSKKSENRWPGLADRWTLRELLYQKPDSSEAGLEPAQLNTELVPVSSITLPWPWLKDINRSYSVW